MSVLEVRDLKTWFHTRAGVVKAVDGVSFTLEAGRIHGLVGESGSGKSITAFSILGLLDPPGRIEAGAVMLGGTDLTSLSPPALRRLRGVRVSMVFQDPMATLNPVLSIGTQMTLALQAHERIAKGEARRRCAEALARVGIPDAAARLDAYPHEFSGGMRQRVAIAIALLHSPEVVLADEPTTALDVSIQAQILHEVRTLAAETGTAWLWISHDLATVSSLADDLSVMYAGRIVEQGGTRDVLRAPRHPYTRGLIDSLPASTPAGEPLAQVRGSAPSLLDLPGGCAFAPRCDRATGACGQMPALTQRGTTAYRCHHPLGDGTAA